MFSTYLYPDSLTFFLVKMIVLAIVVLLWLGLTSAPVA